MQIITLLANKVGNRPFLPVNTNQIMGFPLVVLPALSLYKSPASCKARVTVASEKPWIRCRPINSIGTPLPLTSL